MLEVHCGGSNDSSGEDGGESEKRVASSAIDSRESATEGQLEREQGAISVLERHGDFMRKQVKLAQGFKSGVKLGLVSSKRPIEALLTPEELAKDGHGKRGKTQAEKNRKRKLKKKRAHKKY